MADLQSRPLLGAVYSWKRDIDIARSTVAKCVERRRGLPLQGWKTLLGDHSADIAAIRIVDVPSTFWRSSFAMQK